MKGQKMIKTWLFAGIMAVLVLCSPLQAKTNIFGTDPNNHAFTATAGSNSAVVGWLWTPVEQFSWGFRIAGVLTEAADATAARWDTTLVGIGIEFPVVNMGSLFESLPLDGVGYVGIALDMDIENDQQVYVPIEVGVDIFVNKNVSFRISKAVTELGQGNETPYPDLRFGVKVMW